MRQADRSAGRERTWNPAAPPTSTYRLQIHAGFTYQDATRIVPYLAKLGVSHLFLSPILQAGPGSTHGYDVVDHQRVSKENGGEDGLRALAAEAHLHGMGLVVDVVPNHMSIPTPMWKNHALWSVLRDGNSSEYRNWFDIDDTSDYGVLLPILGQPIGKVLLNGELSVETLSVEQADGSKRCEPVLRYFGHVVPIATGTEHLPLPELLHAQSYRLAYWKVANDELNYRRFFDVQTLAAIRVEMRHVFEATHRTLIRLQHEGIIDGYRIDHPDGLADPRGYLRDLAEATGGAWTVVEKILEKDEELPRDFPVAGTTGYDALWRVSGQFHSSVGSMALTRLWQVFTEDMRPFEQIAQESAEEIIYGSLWAEIARLVSLAHRICEADIMLADTTERQLETALVQLLMAMDRYRAYVVAGEKPPQSERDVIHEAAARAALKLHEDEDAQAALEIVAALALGEGQFDTNGGVDALRAEFMVRFAQTCGPVHAKSLEDTAFYRYGRFLAVNEVGSDPERIGVGPEALHDYCQRMLATFPHSMTTLSTHDTKRSEDVRARLAALTEYPSEWAVLVSQLHVASADFRSDRVDRAMELFLWQTLAALWPAQGLEVAAITDERLTAYLEKAMREAKVHTAWVDGDEAYETEVIRCALGALHSSEINELLTRWTTLTWESQRSALLGQKLIQLTMPGVPDIYQGNETIDLSLVDPDNRRPVDHLAHEAMFAQLTGGKKARTIAEEKLWITSCALATRATHRAACVGDNSTYSPVPTTTSHALAFARGRSDQPSPDFVTVVTRLPRTLNERGGWREDRIVLDDGLWEDAFTGKQFEGGNVLLADLLAELPVALLVRKEHS